MQDIGRVRGWTRTEYLRFKLLKILLKNESRNIQRKNWEKQINMAAKDYKNPQKFWNKIKQLKGNKTDTNHHLKVNNMIITNNKEKEETFKGIWQNIFKITDEENRQYDEETERQVNEYINENIEICTPYELSDLRRLRGENGIDKLISEEDVKNTIKQFKNNTPGETQINKIIMKNLPDIAISTIKDLFNHSLSMGYFPDKFKTAIIKLLPKPNTDQANPINYRPISLLEVPGKILEKIINKRLRFVIERNNILPDTQHGFRSNRGTDTALTTIHETIAHHTAQKKQCYVVLRDVSKAFDKVWHNGLKFKISNLHLPNTITKFLNNFITNRTAKIKINTHTGQPFNLEAGVPQGSALSPTLYTIYTADIPQAAHGNLNIQYADDITQIITYQGKSRQFMATRTTQEIEKINNYERKWKIKTNKSKFKIIPIAVQKKNNIIIDGEVIEFSGNGKILGLTVSRNGINKHINNIATKAKIALHDLYRFYDLPCNIKTHLIKAYIIPILLYPIIPLCTTSKAAQSTLQSVQNMALRFAFDERHPYTRDTKTLHELAHIEPINYTLYTRAKEIYQKLSTGNQRTFTELLENYEQHTSHNWFKKTKLIIDNDPPEKRYTKR